VHIYNPTVSHFKGLYGEEMIPVIFSMGVGYTYKDRLFIAIETTKELEMKPEIYKAGLEYRIKDFLFIRTGMTISEFISHSFGLGFKFKKISIDLAFARHQIIGYTPYFSVQYCFR